MTLRNNGCRVVYFCHILFLLASNCLCNVKMANSYVFNILYGFSWSFRQSISITRSLYVWDLRFWSLWERTNSRRKLLRVKSWLATFCDNEGIFLGDFLKRGATIHSDLYLRTLKTLKCWIRSFSSQTGRRIKPPFFLQSRFSNLRLPSFWDPEGCSPRTPFCGRRRAETQRAWRVLTLQQRVLRDRHTAPHAKAEILCW